MSSIAVLSDLGSAKSWVKKCGLNKLVTALAASGAALSEAAIGKAALGGTALGGSALGGAALGDGIGWCRYSSCRCDGRLVGLSTVRVL